MLPKPHRLPAYEIRGLMHRGKRLSTPELQLVYQANKLGISRFAFIVATSLDKRATVRNRIKRLLRESVRHLLGRIVAGFDIVFIVRRKFELDSQVVVEALVKAILQQAGMVQESPQ